MRVREKDAESPRLGQRLRLSLAATVVLAAAFVVVIATDSERAEGAESVEASFTYFDGSAGGLADLRGRPLVVNFWASWCPPCAAEKPDLQAVFAEYGDQVGFLGLLMSDPDLDSALALVERSGTRYPLAHDPDGSIFRSFGGLTMPTTVLISPEGEVVRMHNGAVTQESLAAMIRADLLDS